MAQSIVIQVGQCGNQIGCRFWDLALREHASVNKKGLYDDAISSFFQNVDTRYADPQDIPLGASRGHIRTLKARAVLVDMEEGVVSEILKGPLKDVFDQRQLITDVSGSGNNWAVGYKMYGTQYKENILESVRRMAEYCNCLQCFFIVHSMGGGTGSGVGTFITSLLEDEFPDIYRFVTAVYPSEEDDVIISPYNSVLAMQQLTDHADCVFPVENQALVDIVNKMNVLASKAGEKRLYDVRKSSAAKGKNEKPFDSMNDIVANMLLNLTSSARFDGSLNVDLSEITMNLVPFPKLHYLMSGQSPLLPTKQSQMSVRRLDQIFSDAFSHDHQLLKADPKHSLYLACACLVRGAVEVSDVRRNIDRLQTGLKFVHWNQEGWKTGMCSVPPVGQPYAMLALANNTCVKDNFGKLRERFLRLYKRKAHMHHYTQVEGMDEGQFAQSLESLDTLIESYSELDSQLHRPPPAVERLKVAT